MTPIPTPEALYRRLRPEPEVFSARTLAAWHSDFSRFMERASGDEYDQIAAAFMLLGMMEGWRIYTVDASVAGRVVIVLQGPLHTVPFDDSRPQDGTVQTPMMAQGIAAEFESALYAAMGAAIDLRRE